MIYWTADRIYGGIANFLPVKKIGNIVSLGEMTTPVVSAPRCARAIGAHELFIKDEGRLPTGPFKARGLAVAVSMAKGAWCSTDCYAVCWQCRCSSSRLLRARRNRGVHFLSR